MHLLEDTYIYVVFTRGMKDYHREKAYLYSYKSRKHHPLLLIIEMELPVNWSNSFSINIRKVFRSMSGVQLYLGGKFL
jgi:hypothetical protein